MVHQQPRVGAYLGGGLVQDKKYSTHMKEQTQATPGGYVNLCGKFCSVDLTCEENQRASEKVTVVGNGGGKSEHRQKPSSDRIPLKNTNIYP